MEDRVVELRAGRAAKARTPRAVAWMPARSNRSSLGPRTVMSARAFRPVDRHTQMLDRRSHPRSIVAFQPRQGVCCTSAGRSEVAASAAARSAMRASQAEGGAISSTSRQSRARWPRTPSSAVQNKSARSRRILRLSVRRVRPPVPGNTASSGTSGSDGRGAAVVDQRDPIWVASRQLVAATRSRAADRGEVALAGIFRGVLDRQPRFIGELAEIDLVLVRRLSQRTDIGTGAKHVRLTRADHHRAHLGVLEAQPLHRVGKLDIDTEVVGIELQLVVGKRAPPMGSTSSVRLATAPSTREVPMAIARGVDAEARSL